MEKSYEELLKYDIDGAIKLIGKSKEGLTTIEEMLKEMDNDPARVPNNPLLTDFNWVYEHVEEIYCRGKLTYQQNQGFEQYYIFFKALTQKYSLDDDYNKYLNGEVDKKVLKIKWGLFLTNMLDFLNYAFDERLEKMLNHSDVIDYLLKYPELINAETVSIFWALGMSHMLKYEHISSYYTKDRCRMVRLIKKHPKIELPTEIMLNENLIKSLARTHRIETFYYGLQFIREQTTETPYLEEHKKYCDDQVKNISDGILPCYMEQCRKSPKTINRNILFGYHNALEKQVINRIFERYNLDKLPSKLLYKELSKYMLIGMFISRNYETDPYNLLIDIETLYDFATSHNKDLQALPIYEFLTTFESKTTEQILDLYNRGKELPLMERLYDDWNSLKYEFIDELNDRSLKINSLVPSVTSNGVPYYDISDVEDPVIVHNTGIEIHDKKWLDELIDAVKNGKKYMICVSVQDQKHNCFYEEEQCKKKKTVKFVYGPLQRDRVGIIWHSDAYSQSANDVEVENTYYKRLHYTLDEFMDRTTDFNEIVYVLNGEPFMPIGVLYEDEIIDEEIDVEIPDEEIDIANRLNIPILYRKKKESTKTSFKDKHLVKRYTSSLDKKLFDTSK